MWTGDFCVDMGQIIDFYSPECNSPVFNPFYNYLEALQPLIFLKKTFLNKKSNKYEQSNKRGYWNTY